MNSRASSSTRSNQSPALHIILIICCFFTNVILSSSFQVLATKSRPIIRRQCCKSQATINYSTSSITMKRPSAEQNAPSQFVVDGKTGEKWRQCAAVAVLNSENKLLVGERIGVQPGAWQCPQGGVNDAWLPEGKRKQVPKESILDASARELYEETGLQVGKHVIADDEMRATNNKNHQLPDGCVRYRTSGTDCWLTRAGFAGQQIHWTFYRCVDALADKDPSIVCDLSGCGGEKAEFSAVKWQEIDDVVNNIWEKKREMYRILKEKIEDSNISDKWKEKIKLVDFTGKWERDNSLSSGLVNALINRGFTREEATEEVNVPYIQSWKRQDASKGSAIEITGSWVITTFAADGETVRRENEYCLGYWDEEYTGKAVIFGTSSCPYATTILNRRTAYMAEPDAKPIPIAHVTVTERPDGRGLEESRRYFKDNLLVLRRTLHRDSDTTDDDKHPVKSIEIFKKI